MNDKLTLIISHLQGRGEYYRAVKAANFLSEPQRTENLESILAFAKKHGCLCTAEEASLCLNRELSKADLESMFEAAKNHRICKSILKIATRINKKISDEVIEEIIVKTIISGNYNNAKLFIPLLECQRAGKYSDIVSSETNKCIMHR